MSCKTMKYVKTGNRCFTGCVRAYFTDSITFNKTRIYDFIILHDWFYVSSSKTILLFMSQFWLNTNEA